MKNILLLPLAVLLAGVAVGGGAAYGTGLLTGPPPAHGAAAEPAETSFVPTARIVAPLVFGDGRLSGYVAFEVELEVASDDAERVAQRLPLLLHAINMRTYRTPMAAGPDGLLPDLTMFRRVVMEASVEAFGARTVRHAAITGAVPV